MHLSANVFDVWVFRRRGAEAEFLLLYTSVEKATRYFNVEDAIVRLDPSEHSECAWLSRETCLDRVHYRGLKDGLRSVHDYVTGVEEPARELCLYALPGG
jgi:hypothetical protein